MKEKIPVNPEILKWARITAGLHEKDVANKINKSIETIIEWESGKDSPTYVQLETLAYQIYKRPLAIFFFPEPPEEDTPQQSFRTLPTEEIESMSSKILYLIRQAKVMQLNLAELNDNVNPAPKNIIRDLQFDANTPVDTIASQIREYLEIDLSLQFSWKSTDEALKEWRYIIEEHGVFVFKEAFKDNLYSGFCLYDETFPVIYLNNSTSKTRQIFSLFHELTHLLLRTGGIDTRRDDYIKFLHGNDKQIEILCNKLSGAFLVPDSDFDYQLTKHKISDSFINSSANQYKVSREVILRKLLDRKLVTRSFYNDKVEEWAQEAQKDEKGKGGNYYFTKGAYLGEHYLQLAFNRYYQQKISVDQLANYLGIKVTNVPGLETSLYNKGAAA